MPSSNLLDQSTTQTSPLPVKPTPSPLKPRLSKSNSPNLPRRSLSLKLPDADKCIKDKEVIAVKSSVDYKSDSSSGSARSTTLTNQTSTSSPANNSNNNGNKYKVLPIPQKPQPIVITQPSLSPEITSQITELLETLELPLKPYPTIPTNLTDPSVPLTAKLTQIQKYITSLEYNHTSQKYYPSKKNLGMTHLSTISKMIVKSSLPIQCVEAVFLGCFFTNGINGVVRWPVSFKTSCEGVVYRHIILIVHDQKTNKYGSLGISRRSVLMYKPLVYDAMSDLIYEFCKCYERCYHEVKRVYVGLPFGRDLACRVEVMWKVFKFTIREDSFVNGDDGGSAKTHGGFSVNSSNRIDTYARQSPAFLAYFLSTNTLPSNCREEFMEGDVVPTPRV